MKPLTLYDVLALTPRFAKDIGPGTVETHAIETIDNDRALAFALCATLPGA